MYADDRTLANPVTGTGLDTQHVAAIVVVASIGLLWAIRRGFRGVNVGGINVGVR